jgi:predicted protein tyrosine phosphatase
LAVSVVACDIVTAERIAKSFDTVLCCGPDHHIDHPQWFGQTFIDRTDGHYAPRREQIERLLDYAREHPGRTLCYCQRGVSRSTAIAIGVAIMQGAMPSEARRAVIHYGRTLSPNRLVLAHVASILLVPLDELVA